MKKLSKKILTVLLALVLVVSVATVAALAASGSETGEAFGSMTGTDFLAKAKNGKITLTDDVTITSGNIATNKEIIINLGTHNLTLNSGLIATVSPAVLTIEGTGTIKATNGNNIVILGQTGTTLNLNGGTIEAGALKAVQVQGGANGGCIATIDGAVITGSGAEVVDVMGKDTILTLKSGSITSSNEKGVAVVVQGQGSQGDATFVMNGGKIEAKCTAVSINNKLGTEAFTNFTMTGGEIIQPEDGTGIPVILADAAAEIKGGTIIGTVNNGSTIQVGAKGTEGSGNLNGHSGKLTVSGTATIKATGEKGFAVYGDSMGEKETRPTEVIIKGGTIEGTTAGVTLSAKAKATISGGSIKGGETGVGALDSSEVTISGNTTSIEGRYGVTSHSSSTVTIEGGTIHGTTAGLGTNGADDTNAQINVTGGNISGGIVGAYLPSGTMNVSGDTTVISGKGGIVARGGTLKVEGGTIEATGTEYFQIGDAKDGDNYVMVPPAAVVVDKHEGYNSGNNDTKLTGGNFKAADEELPAVTFTEKGGEPEAETEVGLTVSGGYYSSSVNESYLDNTIKAEVQSSKGFSYYNSKAAAEKAAEELEGANPPKTLANATKTADIVAAGFLTEANNDFLNGLADDAKGDGESWSKKITDCVDNTFYAAFSGAKTDTNTTYIVVFECGGKKYTESVTGVSKGGIVYFTPSYQTASGVTGDIPQSNAHVR